MRLTLDVLLSMTPEQALLRVRNTSHISGAVCRGLADHVFSLRYLDPSLMERWGHVAAAAAEKTGDKTAAGLARAHFGNALRINGDDEGALAALELAEKAIPGAHPLIHEFRASLLMGRLDNSGAMDELRRAYEMRAATGDEFEVAKILLQMGMVQDLLNKSTEAVLLIERSIGLLVKFGAEGRELLLVAIQNLADCQISAGQLARARALMDELEEPIAAIGKMTALRFTWLRGRLASYSGMDEEARSFYEAARAGYKEIDLLREFALVSLDLALQHHQYGRFAACAREALKVRPILHFLRLEKDAQVANLLAQIAARSGDMELALLALSSIIFKSRQKRPTDG